VLESGFGQGDGPAFRKHHGIAPDRKVIGILPGSRRSEVSRLLPIFKETVSRLAARHPDIHVVVATVSTVSQEVHSATTDWDIPITLIMNADQRRDAFAACDFALAASGTVSLELALAKVPHVIAYRVHWLSALVFRLFKKTRFINLVNILVEHEAVPERLQAQCRPEVLADDLALLISDDMRRVSQRADFAAALSRLAPGGDRPSLRAAQTILNLLRQKTF
jgi:lipid-A-disaccharide synthase